MKSVICTKLGEPSLLEVKEIDKPSITEEDVLIKVEAAGVNRPDIMQRQGLYPPPPGASDIPGLEVAGKVIAINTDKSKFKIGRVRLLLKEPRSTLSWHKDPEPRLHVPIVTNKGCMMVIENVAKHMPADGTATITNNKKFHNFFNGGEQARVHLVACVLEDPFN